MITKVTEKGTDLEVSIQEYEIVDPAFGKVDGNCSVDKRQWGYRFLAFCNLSIVKIFLKRFLKILTIILIDDWNIS